MTLPADRPARRAQSARLAPLLLGAILLASLLAGCTNDPKTPDADNDGLQDGNETDGWNVTVLRQGEALQTYWVNSDPAHRDTDGDGLADVHEFALHLDPRRPDTDGDGLTDCQEVQDSVREHCEDVDWGGLTDGGYGLLANSWDTDRDGLADGAEVLGLNVTMLDGTVRHVTTDPKSGDTDKDAIPDGQEAGYHADPSVADTDGDGCKDGLDPVPGAREAYRAGLRSLTWNGTSTTANVALRVMLGDAAVAGLPQTLAVQPGANDLTSYGGSPTRARQCSFTPQHPWVDVDVFVAPADAPTSSSYDLYTGNPGAALRLWWNVQTGAFSWNEAGSSPFAAPVRFSGAAGTLELQPVVVLDS